MKCLTDRDSSIGKPPLRGNERSSGKLNRLRDLTKKKKEKNGDQEALNDSLNETIKCLENMWQNQKNNSIVFEKNKNDRLNNSI